MTSYASGGLASFLKAPGSQLEQDALARASDVNEGGSFVTTQGQPVRNAYRFKSTNARQHGTAIPARSNVREINDRRFHAEKSIHGDDADAGPAVTELGKNA